jgi:N-glycosylase/DNA lyase
MAVKLKSYPERARRVGLHLKEVYEREGIFGHRELPDDAVKELLSSVEDDRALLFVTLTTALDYMRSASELWQSSLETFRDGDVDWVFEPEEVARREPGELLDALLKHRLAKKKKRDVEVWRAISVTLFREFGGSVRELFEAYDYDVERMFNHFSKERKADFPSLSGSKIFPHWIRSLKDKFNLPFKNLDRLPIPVDVHIARATFTTGCIRGKYSSRGLNETVKRRVAQVWQEALEGTGIAPIEMFRPLWLLSKYGCHYRRNGERPRYSICPARDFCVDGKVIVTASRVEIDT